MIPREWISDVKIERRGERGGMNITLFVEPPAKPNYKTPTYAWLVALAENVFRDAVDKEATRFAITHADVMAWSSEGSRGVSTAHRYRVTADFCPPENLEDGDEDL